MREIKSVYLIKMKVKFGVPIAMLSLKNMSSKYLIENFVKVNVLKIKKKKKTCKAGELIVDYLILKTIGE
jgi:hypothetical protein